MLVTIPIGIPGSGKTYLWNSGLNKKDSRRVDEETLIKSMEFVNSKIVEEFIFSHYKGLISKRFKMIYWDGLAITNKRRKNIIEIAKKANYRVFGIVIDTPVDECIIRCRNQNKNYDYNLLKNMNNIMLEEFPSHDEGFDEIIIKK